MLFCWNLALLCLRDALDHAIIFIFFFYAYFLQDKLDSLVRESDKFSCRYFVTKEEVDNCQNISSKFFE